MDLSTGSVKNTVSRAEAGDMPCDPEGPIPPVTQNFTAFPEDCQVVSGSALTNVTP